MPNSSAGNRLLIIVSLILVLVITPVLNACGGDDDDDETTAPQSTKTESPAEAEGKCVKEEIFKIGEIGTVFGTTAASRDVTQEIPFDEINQAGGIRLGDTCIKFEYTHADDKGSSAGAVAAIRKLLYEFEADAIWHHGSTSTSPNVWRPFIEEEKVPSFVLWPVEEWLGADYDYAFSLQYNTAAEPFILLDWVSDNRPDIKRVHWIRQTGIAYETQAAALKEAAGPEYGIEFTGSDSFEVGTYDFYPILASVLSHNPDAIMVNFYVLSTVAKQARENGFEGTFLVTGALPEYVFDSMKPSEIEGIISQTPPPESPEVPQYYKDFRETYKERQGVYPYGNVTFPAYIWGYYLAAAIKAAESTDAEKIKEVMETRTLTCEFPSGETQDITMGGAEYYGLNHHWSPPEYISVIENGENVVKDIYTPEEIDQQQAIFWNYQ